MSNWKDNFYGLNSLPFNSSELSYWILTPQNSRSAMGWLLGKASFSVPSIILQQNPSESAVSVRAYPFDFSKLTSDLSEQIINQPMFLTTQNPTTLKIGGVLLDGSTDTKPSVEGYRISACLAPFFKIASYTFNRYFNTFLDFSPYTKIKVSLPYIGEIELFSDDVMGDTINIYYNIDVTTGIGTAFIEKESDGVLLATQSAVLGIEIPKVSSDYSEIIRNGIMAAAKLTTSIVTGSASTALMGIGSDTLDLGIELDSTRLSGIGESVLQAGVGSERISHSAAKGAMRNILSSLYNPSIMRNTVVSSYGYSSWAIPRDIIVSIQRPFVKYPSSYNHEYGRPLMETATLKELEGFTIVDSVHMDGFACTDEELSIIERLLTNGVILGEKLPIGLFNVTVNSINSTYSNNSAQAESGSSYVNTFTPNEGYTLEGVEPRIVMNDEAVIGAYTYDAYSDTITINIPEVRGNIIIGVAAVEKEAQRFTIQITAENTVVTDLSSGQVVISSDQGTFSKDVVEGIPISFQFGTKYSGGNFSRLYAESEGNDLSELFDLTESTDIIKVYEFNYTPTANVNIDIIATKPITYTITNALANVVTNADFDEINEGIPYDAVLSGEGNYSMYEADVQVMMGGVDITNTAYTPASSPTENGIIHIDSVNGNIEIYAQAEKQKTYNVVINLENAVNISGFDNNTVELYAPIDAWYTGAFGYKLVTIPTIKIGGVVLTNKYYTLDSSTGQIHINIPADVIDGNVEISIVATKEYSITRNFTNVAIESGNASDKIVGGETYTVNIKGIIGGYVITTYNVMMGGVNVTSLYSTFNQSTGIVSINIPSVNGDIVLTANAEIPAPEKYRVTLNVLNCMVLDAEGEQVAISTDNESVTYTYEAEPDENIVFIFNLVYNSSEFMVYEANGSTNDFNFSGNTLVYDTIVSEDITIEVIANKPNIYNVTFYTSDKSIVSTAAAGQGTIIAGSKTTNFEVVTELPYTEGRHGYFYFYSYRISDGDRIRMAIYTKDGNEYVSQSWSYDDMVAGKSRWNSYIDRDFDIYVSEE